MTITEHDCQAFAAYLRSEERSAGTIEKYLRDVRAFARWLDRRALTRENAAAWRDALLARRRAPATINSMLSALNRFLRFLGREDCRIRFLRLPRRTFREQKREITREDYRRLLDAAGERGQKRLALLMETICSTGIRVSEVRWITLEAARQGRAEISLKGKIRTILLPAKLCRKLLKYAVQGLSPQPAAPVRHGVLPGLPGHREAGRRAGAQLRQYHPNLPPYHRRGTCTAAGEIRAGHLAVRRNRQNIPFAANMQKTAQ